MAVVLVDVDLAGATHLAIGILVGFLYPGGKQEKRRRELSLR
jgi:hypothetical protein